MQQKQCRLARADKYYFGGGSVDIPQRNASQEWQGLKGFFKGAENQYNQFVRNNPTLNMLTQGAQDYFNSDTSELLKALQSGSLSYLQGDQSELLQNLNERALTPSALLTQMNTQAMNQGPSDLLKQMQTQAQAELATEGKLTGEQGREAEQSSLALSAGQGQGYSTQGLAAALLNRDKYANERLKQYQAYAGNVEGLGQSQQAEAHKYSLGVESANEAFNQFGLGTEEANRKDIESRYGLAEDVQKLSNQDIAQRYNVAESVFNTGVSGYTGITDPIYKYFSDPYSSNQNAAAAESVAGANNKSGQTSGAISTIGSVIGAVAMAY